MIEDKAIKLEPGDYILEYDTQKVARVELINMVEGLCDRGIRLWLVRSRGGDALRIVPKETSTTKTTEPMSFEPGDSVLEYITINNIKYLPEVPPKKEHVTPEPFQQVQNVTQGDSLCNPEKEETPDTYEQGFKEGWKAGSEASGVEKQVYKKYLTAEGMREYDTEKGKWLKETQNEAVEAYKKRLVERLRREPVMWRTQTDAPTSDNYAINLQRVVELVEEEE